MAYNLTEYAMLKVDLGFLQDPPEPVGDYMKQLLNAALKTLAADGVAVDQSDPEDEALVVMYAAWLYRTRDRGDGKPPMLRQALNDRKVAGKITGEADAS